MTYWMLAAVMLFDFEAPDEVRSAPSVFRTNMTVSVTNRFATSGRNSLAFHAVPWREGLDRWPSFFLDVPMRDWRDYDRLVLDVVNDGAGGDKLMLYAAGKDGKMSKGVNQFIRLPDHDLCHWVVPLDPWPTSVDRSTVARMQLFFIDPKSANVYIDRIMLLKKGEEIPVATGDGVVRDVLPMLRGEIAKANECVSDEKELAENRARYLDFRDACRTAGQRDGEMLIGKATSMDVIRPRGNCPGTVWPAENLKVRLARGERESVQLIIAPGDGDLKGVKVAVGDLIAANGEVFPASQIDCSVMGYVKVRHDVPYETGPRKTRPSRGWWPDPILSFQKEADVAGKDFQSFWFRVRCSEAQPPGKYVGKVVVMATSGDTQIRRELSLEVRVNSFTIGRLPPMPLAFTFRPTFYFPSEYASLPRVKDYLVRENDPSVPANIVKQDSAEWTDFWADYYITSGSLYWTRVSDEMVAEYVRLKAEGKLGLFNLGYWTPIGDGADGESEWREKTLKPLKAAYESVRKAGLLEHAYLYGCDEATKELFARIARSIEILKAELPGIPLITTAFDYEFGTGQSPLSAIDWFVPLTPYYDAGMAKKSRDAGHKVWWYIANIPRAPYANIFTECSGVERRLLFGAMPARYRPDGFLYYHISIWNQTKCIESGPFTEWEPRGWCDDDGEGYLACVGPKGTPLSTQRLENMRDGLEDLAYVELLRRKTAENPSADWAETARKLTDVPSRVVKDLTSYAEDPRMVTTWRNAMADILEQ